MSAASESRVGAEARARVPWARLLGWFVATRLLIWSVAGASLHFMPKDEGFVEPRGPLDWLMKWDATWFLHVAREGYSFNPDAMSSVNFLPAYPLAVRAATWLLRDIDLAAYVVSHLFCLGATVLLWRLTRAIGGSDRAAEGAIAFFLLGPVNVFFASIYSESTFLFFAVGAFYAAWKQRWLLAGVLGTLATLSRSLGLLLVLPLAVQFIQAHPTLAAWKKIGTWMRFACCALPAAGLAGFFAFLAWKFERPDAYFVSQSHGGHVTIAPWRYFSVLARLKFDAFYTLWFGAAGLAGVVLTAAGALLRLPLALTAFAAVMTAVYLATSIEGMPRFMSVVFPFYCTLGLVRERWPRASLLLLGASGALLVLSTTLMANGYWFT